MTTGISSNSSRLNFSQRLPVGEKFNPLSGQPKLVAQLDMPNPVGDAARDAVVGIIAAIIGTAIAGGKYAFDQAWPVLKPLLVKAKIKGSEGFKNAGDFIKSLNKTGAKIASNGNSKLEAAFNQLLKGAAQAGIIPNVMQTNTSDKLQKIYKAQEQAKYNTGIGDGFKCDTEVNVGRMNGTSTVISSRTTATNKGQQVPVPVEQVIDVYDLSGNLILSKSSAGIGTVPDITPAAGKPLVVVNGYCAGFPSNVRTIDRPYAK